MSVHSPPIALAVKALDEGDCTSARAMLLAAQDNSHGQHAASLLSRLDRAARQENSESLGLAAVLEGEVVGIALFGLVAGARGTAELHGVIVEESMRRRGVGTALLRDVVKLLDVERVRLLVAEVPEDESTRRYRDFLIRHGFAKEGGVPDFIRDGVALAIYRRSFSRSPTSGRE